MKKENWRNETIFLAIVFLIIMFSLTYSIGKSQGKIIAYGECIEGLRVLQDEIKKTQKMVVPIYEHEPCVDCPQFNVTAWDSHTKGYGE